METLISQRDRIQIFLCLEVGVYVVVHTLRFYIFSVSFLIRTLRGLIVSRCPHPVHGFRYGVVIVPSASFLFLTMMMCTLLFYIPFHSPSPNSETLSQGVTNRCRKPLTFMLPFTFSCFVVHDCRSPVYVRLVPPFFTHWARLHNSRHRDASGIVYLFLFFFLSISSCPRYCDGKNLSS